MSSYTVDEILDMKPLAKLGVHCIRIQTYHYAIDPDIHFTTVKDLAKNEIMYYFTFDNGPYIKVKQDDLLSLVVESRLLGYLKNMKTDKLKTALKKL